MDAIEAALRVSGGPYPYGPDAHVTHMKNIIAAWCEAEAAFIMNRAMIARDYHTRAWLLERAASLRASERQEK